MNSISEGEIQSILIELIAKGVAGLKTLFKQAFYLTLKVTFANCDLTYAQTRPSPLEHCAMTLLVLDLMSEGKPGNCSLATLWQAGETQHTQH